MSSLETFDPSSAAADRRSTPVSGATLGSHNTPQPTTPPLGAGERIIGTAGPAQGRVVLVVAGIHGNEPAGVLAFERVLGTLRSSSIELQGYLIGLRGHRAALAREQRFIHRDLNRMWSTEAWSALADPRRDVDEIYTTPPAETAEQRELYEAFRPFLEEARQLRLVDLHTASSSSLPFGLIGDTLRDRRFARALPIPILIGIEEHLEGSLLEAFGLRGHGTFGLEGGRHDDPAAIDCLEAAIWLTLEACNCFETAPPQVERSRRYLAEVCGENAQQVEVLHRHGITEEDGFRMDPGFANFTPVHRGQPLATDARGRVPAIMDGNILLPLYQGQGDDGFFLGRPIRPNVDRFHRGLRWLGLDRLISAAVGARRVPSADVLEQIGLHSRDTIAIPLRTDDSVLQILNGFGYRRRRKVGSEWWLLRRPEHAG
ncbi:MAG: succinylglutamate desuccinylase/aspartoacylase family protein [Planctomycetota bacterium]